MSKRVTKDDCRSCGACCVSLEGQDVYCDITEDDEKKLSKRFVKLNVLHSSPMDLLTASMDGSFWPQAAIRTKWTKQRTGPFKGIEACQCVALHGSLMHRTSCSIYKNRPQTCRKAVKPNDKTCRWVRSEMKAAAEERVVATLKKEAAVA